MIFRLFLWRQDWNKPVGKMFRTHIFIYYALIFSCAVFADIDIHVFSIISEDDFYRRVEFVSAERDEVGMRKWIDERFEYFRAEAGHAVMHEKKTVIQYEYRYSEADFFSDLFMTRPFTIQEAKISDLVFSNYIVHERITRIRRIWEYRETFYFEDFAGIFWYYFRNQIPEHIYLDSEKLHKIQERFYRNLHVFEGADLEAEFNNFRRAVFPGKDYFQTKDLLNLIQVFDSLKDFLLHTRIYFHLHFDFEPRRLEVEGESLEGHRAMVVFNPLQCLFTPYELAVRYSP